MHKIQLHLYHQMSIIFFLWLCSFLGIGFRWGFFQFILFFHDFQFGFRLWQSHSSAQHCLETIRIQPLIRQWAEKRYLNLTMEIQISLIQWK